MAKRLAIPFGLSFDRVLADAVAVLGQPEALCLVLGPRDKGMTVEGTTVRWTDRGEPRSAEAGCPVTAVRLTLPVDGVLDLTVAIAAVRAFGPTAVVLNGGITPVQGVLWAQDAPKWDIQRDGAVRLEAHRWRLDTAWLVEVGGPFGAVDLPYDQEESYYDSSEAAEEAAKEKEKNGFNHSRVTRVRIF